MLMRPHRNRFLRNTRANSAIEFALILPLLALLMAGTAEYAHYARYSRRLNQAAQAIAQVHAAQSGSIDFMKLSRPAFENVKYIFPDFQRDRSGSIDQIAWRVSSIAMTPTRAGCGTTCTYKGDLVFSAPKLSAPLDRECGALKPDDGTPSATTLPSRMFTAASIVVVDVGFAYEAFLGSRFIPAMNMLRQAYATPLNATSYLTSRASYNGMVIGCPGYGNGP